CKCIHAADMCIKKISRVSRISADFCIEIDAATFETACFENDQHRFCKFIDIIWKLVGIPAILIISAVCVHASENISICSNLKFVRESMAGKCGMIYFYIQ